MGWIGAGPAWIAEEPLGPVGILRRLGEILSTAAVAAHLKVLASKSTSFRNHLLLKMK